VLPDHSTGLRHEIQGMGSIARRKGFCRWRKPEAGPQPRVRRRNEAVVERAGAAVKSSDKWRVTLRQAQGRLSDEQAAADIKPRCLRHPLKPLPRHCRQWQ
jgi:hypothetical protein